MELVIQVVIEVVVTGGDRGCDCVRDYVSAKRVIVIDQGNRNIEVIEVLLVIEASWFEQACVYMCTC